MSLRDTAAQVQADRHAPKTKIGKLIAEHPDRLDDIEDLLWGEPRIDHVLVAETLKRAFGLAVSDKQVGSYRKNPEHRCDTPG